MNQLKFEYAFENAIVIVKLDEQYRAKFELSSGLRIGRIAYDLLFYLKRINPREFTTKFLNTRFYPTPHRRFRETEMLHFFDVVLDDSNYTSPLESSDILITRPRDMGFGNGFFYIVDLDAFRLDIVAAATLGSNGALADELEKRGFQVDRLGIDFQFYGQFPPLKPAINIPKNLTLKYENALESCFYQNFSGIEYILDPCRLIDEKANVSNGSGGIAVIKSEDRFLETAVD